MLKKFIVLFIGTLIITTNTARAEEPLDSLFDYRSSSITAFALKPVEVPPKPVEPPKPIKKKPQVHKVKRGDNLTKIAKKYDTSVKRLFYKNKNIRNQDFIKVGQKIKIPKKNEKLKPRKTPALAAVSSLNVSSIPQSGGWTFSYGYCTEYAYSQRPDLPVRGNAREWIAWANSSEPRIGAVAVNTWAAGGYGHVAIVRDIKGDKILVQHKNYNGWNVITTDWLDKSYFSGYIL